MSRTINPIQRLKVKEGLLQGKSGSSALIDANYSEATARHHLKDTAVYKRVMEEIEAEFKASAVTVESVLREIELIKTLAIQKQDYATAGQMVALKGKYLAMFTEKHLVDANIITKQEQSLLDKYINNNRLSDIPCS